MLDLRENTNGSLPHQIQGGRWNLDDGQHPTDVPGASPGTAQARLESIHKTSPFGALRTSDSRLVDRPRAPDPDINEGHV